MNIIAAILLTVVGGIVHFGIPVPPKVKIFCSNVLPYIIAFTVGVLIGNVI